jgi:hypothetical protein
MGHGLIMKLKLDYIIILSDWNSIMKVFVDDSPTGYGKTDRAIQRITQNELKIVFVTERTESYTELYLRIKESVKSHGKKPVIKHISSETQNRGGSVSTEIASLPLTHFDTRHIIVLITHAALLKSDFSDFAGWQIVIDEVPRFFDFSEHNTHLDEAFFLKNYRLEEVNDAWHAVKLTDYGKKLSVADVSSDDSHNHLTVFHTRVIQASQPDKKRFVMCNLPSWESMTERKVKWCWTSSFSMTQLAPFDRIELLGNRFQDDVGSEVTQFFDGDGVEWVNLPPLDKVRHFHPRNVHIGYFSDRCSSRHLFDTERGQAALTKIGLFLRENLPEGNSIWSANDPAGKNRTPRDLLNLPASDWVSPRQAGTNKYSKLSHAAIIYSAKPCPNVRSFLNAVDINPETWTKSTEYETILQFATRTSVRDPNNASDVIIWVFDRQQANYLKDYFDTLPHVTAKLKSADIALGLLPKSKGGRPRIQRTPQEQAAYEANRRQKDMVRKRSERMKRAKAIA